MKITDVAPPTDQDFSVLRDGLNGFNALHTGELLREKVSSFVKDDNQKTLGGILGEIKWGWLYVEGLWVDERVRASGVGSQLLNQLERYAMTKGIYNFRLETTSFQALPFYQKQGYVIFGELPDMPPSHTSFFLKKQIKLMGK